MPHHWPCDDEPPGWEFDEEPTEAERLLMRAMSRHLSGLGLTDAADRMAEAADMRAQDFDDDEEEE